MIYIGEEKEVELRDILIELKKQTDLNYILSGYILLFTVAIFAYEVYKNFENAAFASLIIFFLFMVFIGYRLKIIDFKKQNRGSNLILHLRHILHQILYKIIK